MLELSHNLCMRKTGTYQNNYLPTAFFFLQKLRLRGRQPVLQKWEAAHESVTTDHLPTKSKTNNHKWQHGACFYNTNMKPVNRLLQFCVKEENLLSTSSPSPIKIPFLPIGPTSLPPLPKRFLPMPCPSPSSQDRTSIRGTFSSNTNLRQCCGSKHYW